MNWKFWKKEEPKNYGVYVRNGKAFIREYKRELKNGKGMTKERAMAEVRFYYRGVSAPTKEG